MYSGLWTRRVFFEGISRSSQEALSRLCIPSQRKKQTVLFHEGEPGEAMYLLARGRISLHKLSPDGRETVIKIIKPGEVFAEVILFERNYIRNRSRPYGSPGFQTNAPRPARPSPAG